jgi:DNA-binding transcriptional LysR family regulator
MSPESACVTTQVRTPGACTKDFLSRWACLRDMDKRVELRHLRYFVAVAEEGSLTLAAEKRLHTAQPSLSRQIRDLEYEVGVQLMSRSVRGIELTAAGRAFLDHARLALAQVEAAREAARRAAEPAKPSFALGFLTGQEIDWLPEAMRILRDELPNMEVTVSSQYSPQLAEALTRGKLDVAFMRPEAQTPDLAYRLVTKEPLVAVLPSDHRLAAYDHRPARHCGRDVRQRLKYGSCASGRHQRISRTVQSPYPAGSRGRQSRNGNVSDRLDAGRSALTFLRTELHALVRDQPSDKG